MSRRLVSLERSPLRKIRKQLWPNLSIEEVCSQLDIHWQAWYLTECACYETISPRILLFLKGHEIDTDELARQYKEFQFTQRRAFSERYSDSRINSVSDLSGIPISSYRKQFELTRSAFAKSLCVQPATLYKLEMGIMRRLSAQLKQALLDIGMTEENVAELDELTEEDYFSNAG